MRVLICRSNPVDPDPRVEKVARTLSGIGIPVTVLAWDRTGGLPRIETRCGYTIRRVSIQAEYARGVRNLQALLLWQCALLTWLLHNRDSYDAIHACDFDTILPALLSKLLWGKAVIYDIFDFYADHLRATPTWLKAAIRRIDLWAIRQADALVLADDSRRGQITGAAPRSLVVVYNTPPDLLDQVVPATRPAGSTLHLAYTGLLVTGRGLLEIVEVLRKHPSWSLDLAGFGGDQELILSSARGLPNLVWHGRVPYERALELSAGADILFATYDPAIPNHRFSSPNKLFEAMMLGKPILVCEGTNIDHLVATQQCGLVVPYGDIFALEAALEQLSSDRDLRSRLSQNARRAYEETYPWSIMESRLRDLYASQVSPKGMRRLLLAANTDWYLYNYRLALAEDARQQGYEVTFVSPKGNYVPILEGRGFRWLSWNLGQYSINPLLEVPAFLQILQLYSRERPDLVHHHTVKPVLYGSLAARIIGVPAVFNSITGRGRLYLSGNLQTRLIRNVVDFFYPLALSNPRGAVIFENQDDLDFFQQRKLAPAERLRLIQGVGVDPDRFFPQAEPGGPPVILLAARLLWDKGVGVMVQAARLLRSRLELRVVLVGETDRGNPNAVDVATLSAWQAEGIIEWWGWRADMPLVYNQSHIVVLPSMYREGVPTTLLEAAACGKPLVASDIPGCRDVVQPGVNGFLVAPNDPGALAAALEQLARDPQLRSRMGTSSRQLVMEKFTHKQINAATLKVYQSILNP